MRSAVDTSPYSSPTHSYRQNRTKWKCLICDRSASLPSLAPFWSLEISCDSKGGGETTSSNCFHQARGFWNPVRCLNSFPAASFRTLNPYFTGGFWSFWEVDIWKVSRWKRRKDSCSPMTDHTGILYRWLSGFCSLQEASRIHCRL